MDLRTCPSTWSTRTRTSAIRCAPSSISGRPAQTNLREARKSARATPP
ncbi:hypothetical protein [Ornithinimicrobium kibberense]